MYNNVIKLVKKELVGTDEFGDMILNDTERVVFAEVKSIGMSEFYQAQANGFKPEIKFIIPDYYEYQNEQYIKFADFDGVENEYKVVRTYRNNNELEITCKKGIE